MAEQDNIVQFINEIQDHEIPAVFVLLSFINIISNIEGNNNNYDEPNISHIDYRNISEIDKQKYNTYTTCSICTDDYGKEDMVSILSCNHMYHVNCISGWCFVKFTCPTCRHPIERKIK